MRRWSLGVLLNPWTATAVLAALLGFLAVLQYRWIGEVSRAERQRLRAGLGAAAEHFSDDFGREVARAFFAFQSVPSGGAAGATEMTVGERWRRWRETASQPKLVQSVYVAEPGDGGRLTLARVDPSTGSATAVEWPQ